ncbi:MAG: hypothetical protein ABSD76_10355 [Terriglobales bacterium]|jgi:hypothetical protein
MSIQSVYRRMPAYFAVPLALLASGVVALTLAALGAVTLDFLLGKVHGPGDLGDAILVVFFVAPSIAVLAFVSCFSILVNWHHATSWRTPTFAFVLGAILVWVWPLDFGGVGIAWYMLGTIAWLVSCWLLHRKSTSHSEHVLQA